MAAAEAMVFGIPAVGFNLKAYESYYHKCMLKVSVGDLEAFANTIIKLLEKKEFRESNGKEVREMIYNSYSWDIRAQQLLGKINEN